MKCFYIYNPKSGKGKVFKYLNYIVENLNKIYDFVDVYESKSSIDIIEKVNTKDHTNQILNKNS